MSKNEKIEERKFLKNEMAAGRMFEKTVAKLIRKKCGRKMDERDFEYLDRKLSNGQTVGQNFAEANTAGKCHFYALMLGYGMGEGKIVHGILHNLDFVNEDGASYTEFQHAWLEVEEELVLDPTAKAVFDKAAYLEAFGVEKTAEHSAKEVFRDEKLFKELADEATSLHYELREKLPLFPKIEKELSR